MVLKNLAFTALSCMVVAMLLQADHARADMAVLQQTVENLFSQPLSKFCFSYYS